MQNNLNMSFYYVFNMNLNIKFLVYAIFMLAESSVKNYFDNNLTKILIIKYFALMDCSKCVYVYTFYIYAFELRL